MNRAERRGTLRIDVVSVVGPARRSVWYVGSSELAGQRSRSQRLLGVRRFVVARRKKRVRP